MSVMKGFHRSITPAFAVGDPPPTGYAAWHEWAGVQYRGGLRQKMCPRCCKWVFPQEPCRKLGVCPAKSA